MKTNRRSFFRAALIIAGGFLIGRRGLASGGHISPLDKFQNHPGFPGYPHEPYSLYAGPRGGGKSGFVIVNLDNDAIVHWIKDHPDVIIETLKRK